MTYIGSCCFSRGLILTQAMLQMANITLEMETPCALHALSIVLVSFSSKEVVGTTVWRTGSLLRGKACPPCNIDHKTSYHRTTQKSHDPSLQRVLKVDA